MIVGLSGYAGVGKDEAAAVLVQDGWTRVAFADRLKALAYRLDPVLGGMSLSDMVSDQGWDGAKKYPQVRRYLQLLGASVRAELGEDVWIDAALRQLPVGGDVVVSDVRYRNEADAIRCRGGEVFRIERPGVGPVNGHASETELDGDWDGLIVNDGTIDDLAVTVRAAVAS